MRRSKAKENLKLEIEKLDDEQYRDLQDVIREGREDFSYHPSMIVEVDDPLDDVASAYRRLAGTRAPSLDAPTAWQILLDMMDMQLDGIDEIHTLRTQIEIVRSHLEDSTDEEAKRLKREFKDAIEMDWPEIRRLFELS